MGKTLDQVMKPIPAERRARIERRGQELIDQHLTLQQLRRELNLTQEHMAELLATNQANVSKVEARTDMLLSTLRNYVEAMGGTLELVARMPGRDAVKLEGFRDLSSEK